jgi:hypothetical protein
MTGYPSKKAAASAKTIDEVNWLDHEPDGRRAEQEPQVCCGEYDTCLRACTPRGRHLAQPEQEPLEYWNAVEGWVKIDEVREHFASVGCGTIYKTAGEGRVPVYTTPPQPALEQNFCPRCGKRTKDIHTCTPPPQGAPDA